MALEQHAEVAGRPLKTPGTMINAETKVPASVDALLAKIGEGIAHPVFGGMTPCASVALR